MVNRAGTIVMVNAQVETLFGYQRSELTRQANRDAGARHGGRRPRHPRLYGQRTDGTRVPIEVGVSRLEVSEGQHVLLSVVDIAERLRSERENKDLMDQLQHLAGSLITAQDAERARIARDLHDDVSQQLAALSIALSGLKRRVGRVPDDADLQSRLSSIQQRAVALAGERPDSRTTCIPTCSSTPGLTGALTSPLRGSSSRAQAIAVICTAEGDFESLDAETALCLYRIAQEALHNVVKHARPARSMSVCFVPATIVELTIADDGKGFDIAETRENGKGLGLVSINERVRLAGGTLSIVTEWQRARGCACRLPAARGAGDQGDECRADSPPSDLRSDSRIVDAPTHRARRRRPRDRQGRPGQPAQGARLRRGRRGRRRPRSCSTRRGGFDRT